MTRHQAAAHVTRSGLVDWRIVPLLVIAVALLCAGCDGLGLERCPCSPDHTPDDFGYGLLVGVIVGMLFLMALAGAAVERRRW